MTWLTDAMLTQMRADVANMLPGTAVISSPSYGSGPYPGDATYAASGTVSCRIDPLGNSSRAGVVEFNLGKETMTELYQLTVPYDTTIAADYRVTINSVDYNVIQMDDDHSWNVSKRAVVAVVN